MKTQCADVQKFLGSVRKMNMGGNVVVWGGEKSCTQNKKTGQKTRPKYEVGQYVMHKRAPSKKNEVREESDKKSKGNRFAILATESEQFFNRQE